MTLRMIRALHKTPKVQSMKDMMDKLDFVKI